MLNYFNGVKLENKNDSLSANYIIFFYKNTKIKINLNLLTVYNYKMPC